MRIRPKHSGHGRLVRVSETQSQQIQSSTRLNPVIELGRPAVSQGWERCRARTGRQRCEETAETFAGPTATDRCLMSARFLVVAVAGATATILPDFSPKEFPMVGPGHAAAAGTRAFSEACAGTSVERADPQPQAVMSGRWAIPLIVSAAATSQNLYRQSG